MSDNNNQLNAITPEQPYRRRKELTPVVEQPVEVSSLVRTEQSPPEFVHLQSAIETHIFDSQWPDSVSVAAIAEEGLNHERPYVLGITSAVQGEGKTTTATHLAITMAQNSFKRICLMDFSLTDHIDKDLAFRLGLYEDSSAEPLPGMPKPVTHKGIVDVLEETSPTVTTYQMAEPNNLTIVPGGRPAVRPARSARSPRVPQLLSSARHVFDVIIVDLPSIASEFALPMARYIDGVMIVVQAGATPRHIVQQAIEMIGRDRVIGVALNRYESSVPDWLTRTLRL